MQFNLKLNETRSWAIGLRGPLLICSAQRKMTKEDLETYEIFIKPHVQPDDKIYYGHALCIVEVYDCVGTWVFHLPTSQLSEREFNLGNYEKDRFAWLTRNVRRLARPWPVKGHQGLFNVDIPFGLDGKEIK